VIAADAPLVPARLAAAVARRSSHSRHRALVQATRSMAASTSSSRASLETTEGQVPKPHVLGGTDAVLDPGVRGGEAHARRSRRRGREEALVAVALKGVEQAELGTEVRTFPPADEPGSFSPRREVDQLGELCHPGTVSDLVVHLESPASSLPPQRGGAPLAREGRSPCQPRPRCSAPHRR